eukprot:TRINITY_DN10494_c0_g1_i1.p1 TRINITY_DN10494_c0_g1~~TRINITY_DN10494_c0_g1_i1.p1  ORF type:complete len:148 (+),score=21.20 TRINITY_DN10494_c0_g1_i1:43-486(+)
MAQHNFVKTYFSHPSWCSYCKEFIWGVTKKQGYKCTGCKGIAHGKCRTNAGTCSMLGGLGSSSSSAVHQQSATHLNPAPVQAVNVPEPQRFAKALFDFPPENERELELKKGDVVEVLQEIDEWWFGVLPDKREGFFPYNYVEKIGNW